jgi:hypothetical protein
MNDDSNGKLDDARFKKEKARIGKFLTKWQGPMGLRAYKIQVYWDRSYSAKGCAAETDMSRWHYHDFEIRFYIPELMDEPDEVVERTVVHELVHCLLAPISVNLRETDKNSEYRRQIMEFATEATTKALLWCRCEGEDDYKAELKQKEHNGKVAKKKVATPPVAEEPPNS